MISTLTFVLTFMVVFLLVNYLAPVDKLTAVLFSIDLNFPPQKRDLKKPVRSCSFKSRLKVRQPTGQSQGHLKNKACFHETVMGFVFLEYSGLTISLAKMKTRPNPSKSLNVLILFFGFYSSTYG